MCTKELHKGPIVLVYTLKKHKCKLKLRVLGPFSIDEISSNGAVLLETLDKEPMANFIEMSCQCVYHEPLTNDMLECMHAAKNSKEVRGQMK